MTTKRQLAAIMYTDIAGFSSIMYTDRDLADQIRARHLEIFTRAHRQYNGKLIQQFADTTMSIFDSAAEAVECAYYIQLELRRSPEIPVRIGIHSGEIIQDSRGAYGDGLKIASRIERICEPGSILITAKVYDDIKNHAWISAVSLGHVNIDDLTGEYELYVITNKGVHVPLVQKVRHSSQMTAPVYRQNTYEEAQTDQQGKSKVVAGILALLMVHVGAHRFYLGQRFRAFMYIGATLILAVISAEEGAPFVLFMFLVGLLDAVLFFVMPTAEFNQKYNEGIAWRPTERKNKKLSKKQRRFSFKLLKAAVRKFESQHYEKAVKLLDKVLDVDATNAAAHYYLACAFSKLHDIDDAVYHLSQAMEHGFEDIHRIEKDPALKFVRNHERFEGFRKTYLGYAPTLPPPRPNLLDDQLELSTYDKIEALGERLAAGDLTPEEFAREKTKILKPDPVK
ncbi:MAG: NINE protein [Saprospiraceae bacterium]|nr:NINE protein [Saprospiraceae bacterium]